MKIGVDVVAVTRFRKLKKDAPLLYRVFTDAERQYCNQYRDSAPHFAGLYAAKEAASKALGCERFPILSLEIRHTPTGAPVLYNRNGKRLRAAISISHERSVAVAVALADR